MRQNVRYKYGSTMYTLLIALVAIVFVITVLTVLKIKGLLAIREARKHAVNLGLSLSRCTRSIPYWRSHDFTKPPNFKKRKELGYCLKHSKPTQCRWSLLQRESEPGSEFPPAWRLLVEEGEINENLKGVLLRIAKERQQEYLEIVSTAENVCIYWKERGGELMAEIIYGYLNDISKAG